MPVVLEMTNFTAEVERVEKCQAYLEKSQQEYEQIMKNLDASSQEIPRVFQQELSLVKSHFTSVQHNYLVLLTEQKLLRHISQESLEKSLESIDVEQLEKNTNALEKKLAETVDHCEDLNNKVLFLVESIIAMKNKWPPLVEESNVLIRQINTMIVELRRMRTKSVLSSKDDIQQTKNILQQQVEELTRLTQLKDEIQDSIADQQWYMEDLEDEIKAKNARCQLLQEKVDQRDVVNQREASRREDKYFEFEEQCKQLNRMHGVKNIDFESNSRIKITFMEPYTAILHIDFDKKSIIDVTMSGTVVNIGNAIRHAKKTNVYDGINMVVTETLATLKYGYN